MLCASSARRVGTYRVLAIRSDTGNSIVESFTPCFDALAAEFGAMQSNSLIFFIKKPKAHFRMILLLT